MKFRIIEENGQFYPEVKRGWWDSWTEVFKYGDRLHATNRHCEGGRELYLPSKKAAIARCNEYQKQVIIRETIKIHDVSDAELRHVLIANMCGGKANEIPN